MSLSCDCEYYPEENGEWWFFSPDDFTTFNKQRRKRCCSCKELISKGDLCLEFIRERNTWTEIEEKIKGEQISIASYWMCEKCGEIYLNLTDIGYCMDITEPMIDALKEYHLISGFKKEE